jgi:hypothetical protein
VSNLANPYEPPAAAESSATEPAVVRGRVASGALHLLGGAVLLGLPLAAIGIGLRLHMLVAFASLASFVAVLAALVQAPSLRVVRIDDRNVHIKLEPSAAAAFARAMSGE